MTPEERARACATRIESKLTGPDPRGGSEEDLLGLAVHCFETAVAEIKAEIRAAVNEERETIRDEIWRLEFGSEFTGWDHVIDCVEELIDRRIQ